MTKVLHSIIPAIRVMGSCRVDVAPGPLERMRVMEYIAAALLKETINSPHTEGAAVRSIAVIARALNRSDALASLNQRHHLG